MGRKLIFLIFCLFIGILLILFPAFYEIGTGVAILLFGIMNLEQGFKIFTEGPLRKIIQRSTDKLYKSISVGVVSTALLNSSSLVSVLVISFISAGLISLKAGIGVVFGSNIGTTFTAWLVALFGLNFKISILAMPMIIFGVVFLFQKVNNIKGWGYVTLGLGFLFLGIHYLKTGFESLDYNMTFFGTTDLDFIGLLMFAGIGIALTVLLQSSAASLAIVLTALSVGQISYMEGLALAIGSNIGTTFTAILGSIASNFAGKRIALAHLIFNIITAIVALTFLSPISSLVDIICNGIGIADDNYTLKLAMFHSVFNVLGVALMTPWINKLIRFLEYAIKEKEPMEVKPKYLNDQVLQHPQIAIHALLQETEHMLDHTLEIIAHGLNTHRSDIFSVKKIGIILDSSRQAIAIDIDAEYMVRIKNIYSKIIKYATLIQHENLTPEEQEIISDIKRANRLIAEVIKDLQEFRHNLNQNLQSENEFIRNAYDKFRRRLLKIIRDLFVNIIHFPYQKNPEAKTLHQMDQKQLLMIRDNINEQRIKISSLDNDINGIVTDLIVKKLISSKQATSIINDSVYVTRIGKNLLDIMEALYIENTELEYKIPRIA